MKRRVLCVIASAFALAAATPAHSSVFFSEYVEGSFLNKALEIYNGTGVALDLAAGGYAIDIYVNGSSTVGINGTLALSGTIAPGDVFVIANSSGTLVTPSADMSVSSPVLNFNGDDALVLRSGATIVDSFGQVGSDPGLFWGPPNTQDMTLVRLNTVLSGDTNPFDVFNPAQQWRGMGLDEFGGLGSATLAAIPEPETYALMLAGLGLLGFVARRRRAAA